MSKFVGRRGALGVAIETVRGTPVAPTCWIPYATMSFRDTINSAREEQGMDNVADSDSFYVTMKMGEGDVEAQLYDKALGYVLASLLGSTPSSSGSNPYTHAFTLSQSSQTQSLSLYWKDPVFSLMFPNAIVDSLEINVESGGIVEYTVGFKSKKSRDWTELTPDYTSLGEKFLHQHASIKFANAVGDLAAASAISVKELELTISRDSVYDDVIGTTDPEDVLAQAISVEGSLTLNLEDETYRNYMLDNTYKALQVAFSRSASSSLTLQFPRVDFSEFEPDYSLNEIAKQEVNIKANYDKANDLEIISTASLVNTKASY